MQTLPKAGRYELLEELGRGAMGVVYKAQDPVIGRTVAVKTMRLSEEGTGMTRTELVTRFQTEARAAGLLTHPNIVVVFDAGEEEGLFYIIMELVEGRSLQALLDAQQSFPLPRVLRLMEQACSALEYAHQHNVVHRDIKPANLMLLPDDTLKITDFGTAKILQFGTTQTAQVVGTPSYMSPEQVKGKAVDGRSDVFSLGVILYELVTGEKPFPGQNVTTVIYKIVNEDPIAPRELDSSVHPGLSYVITRALAKEPAARYASCREFMEALHKYRELGPSSDATLVLPPRSPAAASSPPSAEAGLSAGAAVETGRAKHANLWLALALIAIIAGAGRHVWPYVRDVWQYGRDAQAKSGPAAPAQPQPLVKPGPGVLETQGQPQHAPAAAPEGQEPPHSAQPEKPKAAAVKPAPSPVAKTPSPQKTTESAPSKSPAAEFKPAILQRLVEAGLGDKVQLHVAGDTITFSGRLTPPEHRQLLHLLRDAPAWVRVVDHIEYADPAPPGANDTSLRPNAAEQRAGVGWVLVRTRPPGAEIWVDGAPTGQRTPARVELSPGEHAVGVTLSGYAFARRTILVDEGQTALVNVALH